MRNIQFILVAVLAICWLKLTLHQHPDPEPPSASLSSPGDHGVQIRLDLGHSFAARGKKTDLSGVFEIKTTKGPEMDKRRSPLNLAIVLDRSGSMLGDGKLENSKQAILATIERLQAQDTVHLITYDSSADVVFANKNPYEDRLALTEKIRSIRSGSTTNLWGGLEMAAEILEQFQRDGMENRVMLFSDGLVNAGRITDTNGILSRISSNFLDRLDAKVSSYGIGADFNEVLMTEIARVGQGKYFYIENSDAILRFVKGSLSSLLEPLLYDVTLKIEGLNGVSVKEVFGSQGTSDAVAGELQLGDLSPENLRTIVATLVLDIPLEHSPERLDIVKFELKYRLRGETDFRILEGTGSVALTDDPERVSSSQNDRVVASAIVAETSKLDLEVKKALDRGEVETATRYQQQEIQRLEQAVALDPQQAIFLDDATEMLSLISTGGASTSNRKRSYQRSYLKENSDLSYTTLSLSRPGAGDDD